MDDFSPNDPLWKLLGHAAPTKPAPFFARSVLRRMHDPSPPSPFAALFLRSAWIGAAAAVVAGFFLTLNSATPASRASPDLVQAFDIAADFDSLLALDDVLSPEGNL